MGKVFVSSFTISVDGYSSGPHQSLDAPMGQGAESLHEWLMPTATFRGTHLIPEDESVPTNQGVDERFAAKGFAQVGAWILGRNMFGPIRGDWPDDGWKGWWGDNPPYHCPVFVLTHYPRESFEMEGGTVFHFVGDIDDALARARAAAGDEGIRIGGGADVVRQYLVAGAIDEMHFAISPVVLGSGTSPFDGVDLRALGYGVSEFAAGERATHVVLTRGGATVAR